MVSKTENVKEIVEREGAVNFWQGKTPCWEMCHCSEAIKSECPATKYPSLPCWEIEGTYCKLTDDGTSGKDISICQRCRVYRRWGENKPIELKLSGKGIDSFRRFLREKTEEVYMEGSAPFDGDSALSESKERPFINISRRRHEMYMNRLDEIIDKRTEEGGSLTKVLGDIQAEYDWLPVDALEHVGERLEIPSSKVYRTAILGKGLSVIPRDRHRIEGSVCIVDILRYYLDFLQHDLCGKCLPCREGMRQMYNIVTDIGSGEGDDASVGLLRETAEWVAELSACSQGTIAANVVLTALDDYQDQFEEHIHLHKCPTGVCAVSAEER